VAVAALRTELNLLPLPVVLYSGNFEPYQGVDLLLEAAGSVAEAQFVFMGGEPREIEALRSRARINGAAERCRFSGKRPPAELPLFLAASDLLVSPRCRGANTPFKIYSYLASGKPLVATRIPTHTQLLDDSMAFLVEPTAEGLAAGIRLALSEPQDALARAARGRELIEREYSRSRYLEKVGRAYEAVERIVDDRRRATGVR
jgi:glycosyltransferase involved in cell wall biosynthesis